MAARESSPLFAYLPDPVARAVLRPGGAVLPSRIDVRGAVLFADVSGFTAMTEALAARGREGGEALTRILNGFFGAILDGHRELGGTVLRFLGDAMVLLFEARDGEPEEAAVRRALRHGVAMQERVAGFEEARALGLSFRLRMKVGLASGELAIHVLGTELGADFFPYGDALAEAVGAEHHAEPGDIRLSPGVAGMLGVPGEHPAWPGGGVPGADELEARPFPEGDVAPLRLFLPPTLVRRVEGNLGTLTAEIRRVTTSFVGFSGLPPARSAEFAEAIQRYYVTACRIVGEHGGRVNRIDAGDKGNVLHLLFGAPEAHEDDEERGVLAALALRDRLPEESGLPILHEIGVNSGLVYCGDLGSVERHEYTVMGDAVNLAARLMQAASPGEILFSEGTARGLRRAVGSVELPAIRVKGKSAPVRVFHPAPAAADPGDEGGGALVGRTRERRRLSFLLRRLAKRQGGAVVLRGEAGAGKTRLLGEAARLASESGLAFFRGTAATRPGETRLLGTALLRFLLADEPCRGEAELAAALLRRGFGGDEPVRLLAPLLPRRSGPAPSVLDGDLAADRAARHDVLVALVDAEARRRPLLLLVDDVHGADEGTLDLLVRLARRAARGAVLLLLAERAAGADHFVAAGEVERLDLAPLSAAELSRLAARLAGVARIPGGLSQMLDRLAQGNPWYAEELVRLLLEKGTLRRDTLAGRAVLRFEAGAGDPPETLEGVILARLDRLPDRARMLLRIASVAGARFDPGLLRAVAPVPIGEEELAEDLALLAAAGLVQPVGGGSSAFVRSLVRETTYGSLLFDARRELHGRIAAELERRGGEISVERLAEHFAAARNAERAPDLLEAAAEIALGRGSVEIAISRLTESLELLPPGAGDGGAGRRRLSRLVSALLRSGRPALALQRAGELEALARGDGSVEDLARAVVAKFQALVLEADYVGAAPAFDEAIRLAGELGDSRLLAEAWKSRYVLLARIGDWPRAQEAAERAAALATAAGATQLAAEALLDLAWASLAGDPARALAAADEARVRLSGVESPDLGLIAASTRATILQRLGRAAEALATFEEARQEIERRHLRGYRAGNLLEHYGNGKLAEGSPGEARILLEEAVELFRECGSDYGLSSALSNLGVAEQLSGRWKAALDCHRQALLHRRKTGAKDGQMISLANIGEIAMERERLEEAHSSFAEAAALAEELGEAAMRGAILRYLAEIALRRRDLRAFVGHLRDGLPLVQAAGMKDEESAYLRLSAVLKSRSRQRGAAAVEFADALRLAREAGSAFAEVQVLRDWGRETLAAEPEAAALRLREALALAKKSGLGREKAEIGKLLRPVA